jgi:hypothetical protein
VNWFKKLFSRDSTKDVGISDPDLRLEDEFALFERCLNEGLCPICHSKLVRKSYTDRKCEKCNFVDYSANPERSPHATE